VDVRAKGGLPAKANADHAAGIAGRDLVVSPLVNDVDPTGGTLRLTRVDTPRDLTVTADYQSGAFRFRAANPGTYYLTYPCGLPEHLVILRESLSDSAGPAMVATAPAAIGITCLAKATWATALWRPGRRRPPPGNLRLLPWPAGTVRCTSRPGFATIRHQFDGAVQRARVMTRGSSRISAVVQ
jgi:hypothetical protein